MWQNEKITIIAHNTIIIRWHYYPLHNINFRQIINKVVTMIEYQHLKTIWISGKSIKSSKILENKIMAQNIKMLQDRNPNPLQTWKNLIQKSSAYTFNVMWNQHHIWLKLSTCTFSFYLTLWLNSIDY